MLVSLILTRKDSIPPKKVLIKSEIGNTRVTEYLQSVKDALYKRMEEANRQRKTLQQQQYVSKSLKRAFAELAEARTANMALLDATDLFKLIEKQ